MEVKWIEHKGRKILYVDYRGAKNENDVMNILSQDVQIERTLSERVPLLANYENVFVSQKYMDEVKRTGKEIRNEITTKIALVGITGIKKILLNGYILFTGAKNTQTFDTEEQAKDWLVL